MPNTYDLTTGNINKKLILFGLPVFLSLILQSLYNVVDMIVVGQFMGSAGISAISNASSILWVLNSVASGISIGGTVLVAQYKGADDKKNQNKTISTLFSTVAIISFIVTLVTLLFYKKFLSYMNIPIEAQQYAQEYMFVICTGWFFIFGSNAVCAVIRGFGNSKHPFYCMVISTIVNVILDLLFVCVFNMGAQGSAIATVIAEAVAFVASIIYLKKLYYYKQKLKFFSFHSSIFKILLKIGLPTMAQLIVVNLSYLIMTVLLNQYGVVISSATGIGIKIITFMSSPCWAIGQAVSTMVGQNMGAGNIQRVRKTGISGLILNLLSTAFVVIIFQVFAGTIFSTFDPDPQVVSNGILYMRIACSFGLFAYAVMFTFDLFATGLGDSLFAFLNSIVDSVIMRMFFSWFLSLNFGFIGIYWGEAVSSVIPAIIGISYFLLGNWQNKKLVDNKRAF